MLRRLPEAMVKDFEPDNYEYFSSCDYIQTILMFSVKFSYTDIDLRGSFIMNGRKYSQAGKRALITEGSNAIR